MNILVFLSHTRSAGIAFRLKTEGHNVRLVHGAKSLGKGLFEESKGLMANLQWARLILTDRPLPEAIHEKAAMYNKPVIGSCPDMWQINESSINEWLMCKKFGVLTPETKMAESIAQVYDIALAWKLPGYDIRVDREWTRAGHMQFVAWALTKLPADKHVLLQKPIDGVDFKLVGLFDGQEFIKPFFILNKDSKTTGIAFSVPDSKETSFAVQNLDKLVPMFRTLDYKGAVVAHITKVGEQVFFREMRLGMPCPDLYAILEVLQCPLGTLFNHMAFGNAGSAQFHLSPSIAVEGQIPSASDHYGGAPILGLDAPPVAKHTFPCGVMKSEGDDTLCVSGDGNVVFVATAAGVDFRECRRRVTRTLTEVQYPDASFNTHIQQVVSPMWEEISKLRRTESA